MSRYILPTFTGKLFDLESPTEEMICIEDIAHHLSIENRFNGATKFPYSVGYHSILVSNFAPQLVKLEALLHDAEEAYYKDIPAPYKILLKENINTNLQDRTVEWTSGLIRKKFKLSELEEDWKVIKEIDLRMGCTEIKRLLFYFPNSEWMPAYRDKEIFDMIDILKLSAENVEELFLKEYNKLRRD